MDDQHVTSHWGISPAVDLGSFVPTTGSKDFDAAKEPISILQIASYDCRHTLLTICQSRRHELDAPIHLYVYEEEPELLARHVLLLSIMLDESLNSRDRVETLLEIHGNVFLRDKTAKYLAEEEPERLGWAEISSYVFKWYEEEPEVLAGHALLLSIMLDESLNSRDRVETLLEIHGNVFLRDKTAKYLDRRAKELEELLVNVAGGDKGKSPSLEWLESMLDLSALKYQQRDLLVVYDMAKAWDARGRKFYQERFDFRRNMVDWDYHMRLSPAGTPGQDEEKGMIIHFHHFRHWRMSGVAYELRDSNYNCPNRSLLSMAYGRTKEFKDRNGKDVGRSVSAWGFWGDQLNSSYHSFGTVCEEDSFYKYSNKQWVHHAVDIAEHNITALIHELRTGERYSLPNEEATHAKLARGPTTMEDLTEYNITALIHELRTGERYSLPNEEATDAKLARGSTTMEDLTEYNITALIHELRTGERYNLPNEEATDAKLARGLTTMEDLAGAKDGKADEPSMPSVTEVDEEEEEGDEAKEGDEEKDKGAKGAGLESSTAALTLEEPTPSNGESSSTPASPCPFIAAASFQGPKSGYAFQSGNQGLGYYLDSIQIEAGQIPDPAASGRGAESGGGEGRGGEGEGAVSSSSAEADEISEEKKQQMEAEAKALRTKEAAVDADAREYIRKRFKLILSTGNSLPKAVTGKSKLAGCFSVVTVGHRHIHLLQAEHQLEKTAKYMVQLKKEAAAEFEKKIAELAGTSGWVLKEDTESMKPPPAFKLFTRP
eukprot:gene19012-25603_t